MYILSVYKTMVTRTLTPYQCYRLLTWTTDDDECEAGCGIFMNEDRYAEGLLGHYCSLACLEAEEGEPCEPNNEHEHYLETNTRPRGDREDFHSDG